MQVTQNATNNTTLIVTPAGQATLPTALFNIFAACTAPTALVQIVQAGVAAGFTNGFIRAQVQVLAQPGQYNGSPCIGAICTSTQGKRVFVQFAVAGAARPKLTRTGSNQPAAHALAAAPTSVAPAVALPTVA